MVTSGQLGRDQGGALPYYVMACLTLSGREHPNDKEVDGKSPIPLLTSSAKSPHQSLYFEYRNHAALRMGDWKLVRERSNHPWQLFNLKDDPQESKDQSKNHRGVVGTLHHEFARWQRPVAQSLPG